MTSIFMDTSALTKRYVPEVGTNWIQSLISRNAGNVVFIASITQAEIVSAVMRRKRDGKIPARTARAMRLMVDRHVSREYRLISLMAEVIKRSED